MMVLATSPGSRADARGLPFEASPFLVSALSSRPPSTLKPKLTPLTVTLTVTVTPTLTVTTSPTMTLTPMRLLLPTRLLSLMIPRTSLLKTEPLLRS
jgi:hypothetical protein